MFSSNIFIAEYLGDKKHIPFLSDKHFQLKKFEAAEAEILEFYDQNCTKGIECYGCARDLNTEKAIASKHGVLDFEKFDELFSRNYY
jgi:hypothetical protein